MHDPKGSLWRKWDLHVHTPASIEQEYGGDTDEAWGHFLTDLERLPDEFKVIGINDYLFLDGYRRVRAERARGRLQNLDLVLPVVELRVDKFGGANDKLSRVNFHVLFSDELDPDDIEGQFLAALTAEYYLSEEYEAAPRVWNASPTRRSVTELGEQVLASIPEAKRPSVSPLHMGFNCLNFPLDKVHDLLKRHIFKDKHVTAVGRGEWDSIRWDGQAVADKKTIVNRAHFVFANASTPAACVKARNALHDSKVNHRLLDCSDAHRLSSHAKPDRRLGKCWTWIKGDPAFTTLRHVYHEPGERIHLGDRPEVLTRVASHPTKFIRSLTIGLADAADAGEPWFAGARLAFNPGLVAVIGNKGSGKSALVDILSLLGDSDRFGDASFLTPKRFADPAQRKAARFVARLTWASGDTVDLPLDAKVAQGAHPTVKYVPQNLFERICSDVESVRKGVFDRELKSVIFSHVPDAERLGTASLDALVAYKTREVEQALELLYLDLHAAHEELVVLHDSITPKARTAVETGLVQKRAELEAHRRAQPVEPPKPDVAQAGMDAVTRGLIEAREQLDQVEEEIASLTTRQATLARELAALARVKQKLAGFRQQAEKTQGELARELGPLELTADAVLRVTVDEQPVDVAAGTRRVEKANVDFALSVDADGSRVDRRAQLQEHIRELQNKLDEPGRLYEAYITAAGEWSDREAALVGDADTPDSVAYLEAQLAGLDAVPQRIVEVRTRRDEIARAILGQKRALADELRALYGTVQHFIATHELARSFDLRFSVTMADAGFEEGFFGRVNRARAGSFHGNDGARDCLRGITARHQPDHATDPVDCANAVLDHLYFDRRADGAGRPMRLAEQLLKGHTEVALLDYLFRFDYLEPRYGLRLGAKELHQLSPGERGALLLVFYLLVDRDDTPLLIDQPEENLDNQTVYKLLVPSILEAKRRRQIFIVTHNPNLAVVCDAEQIVVAQRDPVTSKIEYPSGAIEYHTTNRHAVDILEGTWPALNKRNAKYLA